MRAIQRLFQKRFYNINVSNIYEIIRAAADHSNCYANVRIYKDMFCFIRFVQVPFKNIRTNPYQLIDMYGATTINETKIF